MSYEWLDSCLRGNDDFYETIKVVQGSFLGRTGEGIIAEGHGW